MFETLCMHEVTVKIHVKVTNMIKKKTDYTLSNLLVQFFEIQLIIMI